MFFCTGLTDLTVSGNGLSEILPAVKNLKDLRFFTADSNNLGSLSAEITQLPALQKLSLADNRLAELPADLGNCRKLYMLDVSGNVLQDLPASITGLPSLGALFLQHNRLDSLPEHIETLSELHQEFEAARYVTLDISDNRLCALKGMVKAWADRFDPGWQSKQDCLPAR